MNEEEWMLTSTNGRYPWSYLLRNSVTPNQVMMTTVTLELFNGCQLQICNVTLVNILFIIFSSQQNEVDRYFHSDISGSNLLSTFMEYDAFRAWSNTTGHGNR